MRCTGTCIGGQVSKDREHGDSTIEQTQKVDFFSLQGKVELYYALIGLQFLVTGALHKPQFPPPFHISSIFHSLHISAT
jgi:hypothetical protein